MESQIKGLLEKYWQGETSVEEESLIKKYFIQHPHQSAENLHFENISKEKSKYSHSTFEHPGRKIRRVWLSVAAALLLLLITVPFVFNNQADQDQFVVNDPTEALEITRASLRMVSDGLNKGKSYSNELAKFNDAKQIIKKQ